MALPLLLGVGALITSGVGLALGYSSQKKANEQNTQYLSDQAKLNRDKASENYRRDTINILLAKGKLVNQAAASGFEVRGSPLDSIYQDIATLQQDAVTNKWLTELGANRLEVQSRNVATEGAGQLTGSLLSGVGNLFGLGYNLYSNYKAPTVATSTQTFNSIDNKAGGYAR